MPQLKITKWIGQLQWHGPYMGSTVQRSQITTEPGCYVFTDNPGPLKPPVLYVGKAANLRNRVWGYLRDYAKSKSPTRHKGRAFIYDYRHQNGNSNLYVRWAVYGDPAGLEGSLIVKLEPLCNSRWEDEFLDEDELLDPIFLP